jgi:hypothetical protein
MAVAALDPRRLELVNGGGGGENLLLTVQLMPV